MESTALCTIPWSTRTNLESPFACDVLCVVLTEFRVATDAPNTTAKHPIATASETLLVASTDAGRTFSAGVNVSEQFARGVPSMPGGTQLPASGPFAHRLIVPMYRAGSCPRAKGKVGLCSYLVLSDDHGASWRPLVHNQIRRCVCPLGRF